MDKRGTPIWPTHHDSVNTQTKEHVVVHILIIDSLIQGPHVILDIFFENEFCTSSVGLHGDKIRARYLRVRYVLSTIFHRNIENLKDINMFS